MPRARRPFLAHPFWRDYVVALILIGVGFMLGDIAVTTHDRTRPWIAAVAFTLFVSGWLIFACAVGWSIRTLWRIRSLEAHPDATDGRCPTCGRAATVHLTVIVGRRKVSRSFCPAHVPPEYRERLALDSPVEQLAMLRAKLARLDESPLDPAQRAMARAHLEQLIADIEAGRRGLYDENEP